MRVKAHHAGGRVGVEGRGDAGQRRQVRQADRLATRRHHGRRPKHGLAQQVGGLGGLECHAGGRHVEVGRTLAAARGRAAFYSYTQVAWKVHLVSMGHHAREYQTLQRQNTTKTEAIPATPAAAAASAARGTVPRSRPRPEQHKTHIKPLISPSRWLDSSLRAIQRAVLPL